MEQECAKERQQEGEAKTFRNRLSEGHAVVIIREFRTVSAHRLFCFAASRPVKAPVLRANAARLAWPSVVLRTELCGWEVAR